MIINRAQSGRQDREERLTEALHGHQPPNPPPSNDIEEGLLVVRATPRGPLASLGKPFVDTAKITYDALRLTLHGLGQALSGHLSAKPVLQQMVQMGNRSLPFIMVTLTFFGIIFVYQACFQAQRVVGDLSPVGPAYIQLIITEFGPTLGGLMLCTRVATGIGAHLGTMAVTDQIDALKTCNACPVRELVAPRLLAGMLVMPVMAVYASLVAIIAGMLTALWGFGVHPQTFFDLSMLGYSDVVLGGIKSLAFGLAIPAFACQAGLQATGGSRGIGQATTVAVVRSSVAVIALDFVIGAIGHLVT